MTKKKDNQPIVKFDKYREIKYIGIWFAIVGGTATLLKTLNVEINLIIFVIIIIILLISNYLKDKEIQHLKEE